MEKLILSIVALFFIVAPADLKTLPEISPMYIEEAMLSEEENHAAELFNTSERRRVYDFKVKNAPVGVEISTYQLEDGSWRVISRENRQVMNKRGRIALGFDNIGDGIRVALQDSETGVVSSYTTDAVADCGDMGWAAGVLSGHEKIGYDEEKPLILQVVTSGNPVNYYLVQYFYTPEVYEDYDYEQVFAVTIRFYR